MHFPAVAGLVTILDLALAGRWTEDWPFTGLPSFAKLPFKRCLVDNPGFDIAVLGVPFDTAVSFHPGAGFGPQAIRRASQRQNELRGFNARAGINPYEHWGKYNRLW